MLEILIISLYFNFILLVNFLFDHLSRCVYGLGMHNVNFVKSAFRSFPCQPHPSLRQSEQTVKGIFLKIPSNIDDWGKQSSFVVIVDTYLLALTEKIPHFAFTLVSVQDRI